MLGGPVLVLELLLGSRRNRLYIFRYIYAGWLLLEFMVLYFVYAVQSLFIPEGTATFATSYVEVFVWQQLILLAVATPALAAGAVTDEKERGTLQYLLAADLTPGEIIIGKLFGRLTGVMTIFLAGAPFLCFVGSFTGMGFFGMVVVLLEMALAAFALASASLLASVWNRHTRDAVLSLYAVGVLATIAGTTARVAGAAPATIPGKDEALGSQAVAVLAQITTAFDPLWVLQPALLGGETLGLFYRLLWHALAWGSVGGACLALALLRLRPAYIRQLEGAGKQKRGLLASVRPRVGKEPVRWKERFVVGLAPLPWFRFIPRWLGAVLIFTLSALAGGLVLAYASGINLDVFVGRVWRGEFGMLTIDQDMAWSGHKLLGLCVVALAGTVVGIRCSGAITGEREKHTWEPLLLSPLTTRQLVRAKLWGVIGATYPYLIAYAVPMFYFMLLADPVLIVHLVLQLAVIWLAMFYVGSAGLYCSARSKSSWRSLLATLAWAYLGGAVMASFLTPIIVVIYVLVQLTIWLLTALFGLQGVALSQFGVTLGVALFLATFFLLGSWYFLWLAEKYVNDNDRMRHWRLEPDPPFRRRAPIREALPVDD